MSDKYNDPEKKNKMKMEQPLKTGFVFALGMEAGSLVDLLDKAKTTKGNGLVYHDGFLGENRVVLLETGVGRSNAAKGTEAMIDVFRPQRIVSSGFAGALDPSLAKNSILCPEKILMGVKDACKDIWIDISGETTMAISTAISLLTVDHVVATVAERQELWNQTGANLVDMESFAVAEVCKRQNVPFHSVRIILDTAQDELPREIQRLSEPDLTTAKMIGSLIGMFFKRPSCVLDLYHFKERGLIAADLLAAFLQEQFGH